MVPSRLFCTVCGAENQVQDAFCFVCGRPLRGSVSPSQSTMPASTINAQAGFLVFDQLLKDRYRILGKLGKGGMGTVYKAEDSQFGGRLIAVKEMSQVGLNSHVDSEFAVEPFG